MTGAPGSTGATGPQGTQGVTGVGTPGPVVTWRGTWASGPTYATNDAVASSGSSYLATGTSTAGVAPPAAPWALMAQQGATGPQGIQGIQGPTGTVAAAGDGTLAAQSHSFASDAATGMYRPALSQLGLVAGGATQLLLSANTLEQRNGVNAQTLRIYGSYTDASNYERLSIAEVGASWEITSQQLGTGVAKQIILKTTGNTGLYFGVNNTQYWFLDAFGRFMAQTDNAVDIGASASSRPKSIYAGTSVVTPALVVSAAPAFVAGDRYLVVDASGNVHKSAIGPAS